MIRIAIVCNNGCSSSVLAKKLNQSLQEKNQSEFDLIEAFAYALIKDKQQNYDIILLCPQTYVETLCMNKDDFKDIPLYFIPPNMFVHPQVDDLLEDVEDVLRLYPLHKQVPFYFEDEENYMANRRKISYRKTRST